MRTTKDKLIGAITLIAIFTLGIGISQAFFYAPESELTEDEVARGYPQLELNGVEDVKTPDMADPVEIFIPIIDVRASIQDVGISLRGNMAVPSNYRDVGWYRYGPKPGEVGSAVMAGHYDNGAGFGAVFRRLEEVRSGDDIYITNGQGVTVHFIVREVLRYSYLDMPLTKIFNTKDSSWLNLITCSGQWLDDENTYTERIVVFAELI